MAKNKKNKLFLYTIVAILIIGVVYLFFSPGGVLKFIKLKNEISSLNEDIKKLSEENIALQNEIDSLRNEIPAKIEKVAREKYDMIKEGEIVIEVKEIEKDVE
jgi:cell division protein FtsB